MAGISRMTALMVQNWPDIEGDGDDRHGISIDAIGPHPSGKYAGWISLWKDGRPHISPLLSSEPIYDSAEAAEQAMRDTVTAIRRHGV